MESGRDARLTTENKDDATLDLQEVEYGELFVTERPGLSVTMLLGKRIDGEARLECVVGHRTRRRRVSGRRAHLHGRRWRRRRRGHCASRRRELEVKSNCRRHSQQLTRPIYFKLRMRHRIKCIPFLGISRFCIPACFPQQHGADACRFYFFPFYAICRGCISLAIFRKLQLTRNKMWFSWLALACGRSSCLWLTQ